MSSLEYLEAEAERLTNEPRGLLAMGRQPDTRASLEDALQEQRRQLDVHGQVIDHATRALEATRKIIAAMEGALIATQGEVDA